MKADEDALTDYVSNETGFKPFKSKERKNELGFKPNILVSIIDL